MMSNNELKPAGMTASCEPMFNADGFDDADIGSMITGNMQMIPRMESQPKRDGKPVWGKTWEIIHSMAEM